jgi:hypothetical protein
MFLACQHCNRGSTPMISSRETPPHPAGPQLARMPPHLVMARYPRPSYRESLTPGRCDRGPLSAVLGTGAPGRVRHAYLLQSGYVLCGNVLVHVLP